MEYFIFIDENNVIRMSENKNNLFLSVYWIFNEMLIYFEGKEEIYEDIKNNSFFRIVEWK